MDWDKNLEIRGMDEAELKSITVVADLTATIPIIWNPTLEKNYHRMCKMEQFAVVNTDLLDRPGDTVRISKMNDIGPAEDLEKTGPAGEAARGAETRYNNTTDGIETAFTSRNIVDLVPTVKFKAVKFSRKAMVQSFVGRMNDAMDGLAYAFALKTDMDAFGCLNASTNIVGPSDWSTLVPGDIISTLSTDQAKLRYDISVEMNDFAYFAEGTVVCLVHPFQYYHLTQDVDLFDVVKRNMPNVLFKDEMFTWKNVRYIKSTGVPFYAGGVLTEVGVDQDMVPVDGATTPNDTWLLSNDGTYGAVPFVPGGAGRQRCIAPRYQTTVMAPAPEPLAITIDATDAGAKIVLIDHHHGMVKFDVPVGGTVAPTAKFTYGTVYGYSSPIIGPRAYCIAKQWEPALKQEISNYGNFIGIGGDACNDIKILNAEQVVRLNTAVVPPFSVTP